MQPLISKLLLSALLMLPVAAAADNPVTPPVVPPVQTTNIAKMTPEEVAEFLQKLGYRAVLAKTSTETYVQTNISGFNVAVWLYNCDNGCNALELAIYGKATQVDKEFANDFNMKWRFGKMDIFKDGTYRYVYDINLVGGVAPENLQSDVLVYETLLNALKH